MDTLDAFDRRLLDLLEVDSRRTGQDLAEEVGLSPAACLRRVQRLRANGAIEREVAILSPDVAGPSVTILVLLRLKPGKANRIDLLKQDLLARREVRKFYHVTGEADIALTVTCPSMEAYALFTEAHFFVDLIAKFESIVVLREYQRQLPAP